MTDYHNQSQSYRRGFVEGQTGEPNTYLLLCGTTDLHDYDRGYRDGFMSINNIEIDEKDTLKS